MTNSIESTLSDLKTRGEKAKEQKMRAGLLAEQAETRIAENRAELKDKFKVTTDEEAEALIVKLEAQINDRMEKAKAILQTEGD